MTQERDGEVQLLLGVVLLCCGEAVIIINYLSSLRDFYPKTTILSKRPLSVCENAEKAPFRRKEARPYTKTAWDTYSTQLFFTSPSLPLNPHSDPYPWVGG